MMQKRIGIWLIVFLAALILLPPICPAAYLIELKSGIHFITEEYWDENGKITFSHSGGIVGISKEKISSITDTEAPVPEEIMQTNPPVIKNLADSMETEKFMSDNIDNNKQDPDFEKKVQKCKESRWRIQDNMITQKQYFDTAKEQNDQTAKDETWKRLIELNKEQNRLRQKVKDLYQGTLPEWWD